MYVLRCTQRLLRDTRRQLEECSERTRSTTRLGDWYANRLSFAQQRYILVVNAHTLLSVVVPARDPAGLPERIRIAVDALLRRIGVPRRAREAEIAAMAELGTAPARDRSVIASMNAQARRAWEELYDLPHRRGRTLGHIDALLSGIPLARLDWRTPADVASARLVNRGAAAGGGRAARYPTPARVHRSRRR